MQQGSSTTLFLLVGEAAAEMAWHPLADLYRTADGWVIKLELAGVCAEDITVATAGSRVYISGCRRDRIVEAGWNHYSMEIAYGHFARTIELPDELDRAAIRLECREGMVIVRLKLSDRPEQP